MIAITSHLKCDPQSETHSCTIPNVLIQSSKAVAIAAASATAPP
jgi:hypothetical protein